MKFFEWTTDYQLYRKQTPKREQDDYPVFFRRRLRELREYKVMPIRLLAEHCWTAEGSAYYNIHPKLVSKLCKVDLTKIPSHLFQMPHGSRAVNIRFAQQHDEFTVTEEMISDNVTHSGSRVGVMPPGSYCHSVLMIDNRAQATESLPRNLLFIMDFDVYTKHNQPVYTIMGILPIEGRSIEDLLVEKGGQRGTSYDDMIRNIMRLAVTVGFLSDNPTICEFDVLSKDRPNFCTADDDRRRIMIERAKRKGKLGYNVGNDLMFVGSSAPVSRQRSEGQGRELEYAHIRGGHPHAVRYGEGKQLVKIMWFAPTTVRDDLPFKVD